MSTDTARALVMPARRPTRGHSASKGARVPPTAPHMPERALQNLVRAVALALNWGFYHTHDSRKSAPGFPDCVLVKGRRLIFAELKTATGKLSPPQVLWLAALKRVPGVEVYLWTPADWHDGTIEKVLSGEGG